MENRTWSRQSFFDSSILELWYDSPSFDDCDPRSREGVNWEREAMLLGNGHMGAIIYGGIREETITMNEKTLWQGGPGSRQPGESGEEVYGNWKKAARGFPELRKMIFQREDHEVDPETARNMLLGNPASSFFREKLGAYQPLCDLKFTMDHGPEAEAYIRGLDLDTATALVDYRAGGIRYQRLAFMNYPDNVFVENLIADRPGALSFTLSLACRQPEGWKLQLRGNRILLAGELPSVWYHNQEEGIPLHGNHMKYEAQVSVETLGGRVVPEGQDLRVENADRVWILFAAGTDYVQDYSREYRGEDPHRAVTERLDRTEALGYEALRSRHLEDYCPLYRRVVLDLGQKRPEKPTDLLADGYRQAPEEEKRWLEVLAFNLGRYLLLSSSRAGSLPANLQGVWNPILAPIWESDYHININLEMNYWMADLLSIPETLPPLENFIRDLQKAGTVTAETIYGFRDGSWVTHNPTNPLGHTGLQFYGPGLWYPEGSAWLLRHLMDHYDFTGNREYLRRIYPLLQGNVKFWLNYLVEDPLDPGVLICCPTCLPEQPPFTMAASMSMQAAEDLLRNFIRLSEDLENLTEEDRQLLEKAKSTWQRMDHGLRVDPEKQIIRDWKYKPSRAGGDFRHFNQLYAFYPGDALNQETENREALQAGAARFLAQRSPLGTPGWSRVWRCALWARLREGEKAFEAITSILRPETLGHNLLMRHPPFQIDANLGYPAAMGEMLLQSHEGYLHLLPALPEEWGTGSFSGFSARGSFLVDAAWKDHRLTAARILARRDGPLVIRQKDLDRACLTCGGAAAAPEPLDEDLYRIPMKAGQELTVQF